jgi:hypothetical protein
MHGLLHPILWFGSHPDFDFESEEDMTKRSHLNMELILMYLSFRQTLLLSQFT